MATSSSSEELSPMTGVLECRDKEFFLPCMNVQCDWSEAAAKYVEGGREGGKFWISCRRPVDRYVDSLKNLQKAPVLEQEQDSRTFHGHIQVRGQGEEGVLESVSDRFTVTKTTPSSLTVECRYSSGACRTTFVKPEKTIHLHPKTLSCMDISGSCALGVCASENGKLWVWDPDTGETRRELKGHVVDVETCRFFPSGIVVLSGGADMRLKIWSAQDGTCPRTLIGHTGGITDTAFIDKGRNIVSVSRDGTARLWDCGSARCLGTIASTDKPIYSCSISASGLVGKRNPTQPLDPECGTNDKLLALACGDRYLRGVDVRSRKKAFQVFCRVPSSCVFVSDHELVCGGEDGVLLTWDIRNSSNTKSECLYLTESAVTSLTPVNPQTCLAGHADGTSILWRLDEPYAPVSKLTGPDIDHVTTICINGNKIYTSCRDGCVRVYSTNDIIHL